MLGTHQFPACTKTTFCRKKQNTYIAKTRQLGVRPIEGSRGIHTYPAFLHAALSHVGRVRRHPPREPTINGRIMRNTTHTTPSVYYLLGTKHVSREDMRKALWPAHVMSESQMLESNPATSGALVKSNHRGPGVPLLKIPGARISSFGGSSTWICFTRDRNVATM